MGSISRGRAPVVTLAALYGAGGSVVGREVAERLEVPFLDRSDIERAVDQTGRFAGVDDEPRASLRRIAGRLGGLSTVTGGAGGSFERIDAEASNLRGRLDEQLATTSEQGGVALGRGGMVILRSVPWALHVHLGGPAELRVQQAMVLGDIGRTEAEARQPAQDRERTAYVRRLYGVDGSDPSWYHLMLDSTALDLDTCIELIVAAAVARARTPRPSPPQ